MIKLEIPNNIFEVQPKYSFGSQSLSRLVTVDHRLEMICRVLANYQDISIICGHRDMEAQTKAVAEGKSKTAWPNSKHNFSPSLAVDIAPWKIDWNDHGRFRAMAGRFLMIADFLGTPIRWGGDWDGDTFTKDQRLIDLPHFEIIGG